MGERALGWGLRLLGIALSVGPFVAAFAVHNWDFKAALMPSQAEIGEVKGMLTGLFEKPSEEMWEVQNLTFDGTTIRATARIKSPFKVQVKITDVSGDMSCKEHGVHLTHVQMEEEEVEVQPRGATTFALVGAVTQEGVQHLIDVHGGAGPTDPSFENVEFTLELYGVSIKVSVEGREEEWEEERELPSPLPWR